LPESNTSAVAGLRRLIKAQPEDIALISSVSYGIATAGKVLRPPSGSRVLVLENDHSSPVLEWLTHAAEGGFAVETVKRPSDGDWTTALLAATERPGAAPVALASISSVHWSDGGVIDLGRVAPTLRARGAALIIDATHAAGVMPLDVNKLDPDFLVFPTYKWVLGPYGRAFLYIAKRHQDGIPLEQTGYGRRGISSGATTYLRDLSFVASARRFDMGERDHFVSMGNGLDRNGDDGRMGLRSGARAANAPNQSLGTLARKPGGAGAVRWFRDRPLSARCRQVGQPGGCRKLPLSRRWPARSRSFSKCGTGSSVRREDPGKGEP
jgi:hypothetical protein